MSDDKIKQLAYRVIKSEKDAFDDLFRLLYAPLVRFAFKYTRQKSSAGDIVQDAFVKLWLKRKKLDPEQSVKAYLFKIVRNLSLNYLRDNSHESKGLEADNLVSDMSEGITDHSNDEHQVRLDLLKQWIQNLPERQRDALEMSRFEGLSHKEIAEVMNVSKRTVNNHIVAAMKNMKRFHDEHQEIQATLYG